MSLRLFLEGSLRSEYIIAYSICVVCKARTGGIRWLRVTYFLKGGNSNHHILSQGGRGESKIGKKGVMYFVNGPLSLTVTFILEYMLKLKFKEQKQSDKVLCYSQTSGTAGVGERGVQEKQGGSSSNLSLFSLLPSPPYISDIAEPST